MFGKIITLISLAGIFFAAHGADTEKPAWATHNYGMESLSPDYIEPGGRIPPMQCSGNTVIIGSNRVRIGANGLPAAVSVREMQVLSAPAQMLLEGIGNLQPKEFSLEKTGENAVSGKAVLADSQLEVETTLTVEHDYTFIYSIRLVPKGRAAIRKFALEFPMNLAGEKLISATNEPGDKPEAGVVAQRRRLTLNVKDTAPVKLSAWNNCWIGNTRYGLSWSFESVRGWNTPKGEEMVFSPADGKLAINIISEETILEKPVSYRFYFNVTPFREMPKNWRTWQVGTRYNNTNPVTANKLIYWSFWRIGSAEVHNSEWVRDPARLKEIADFDAGEGRARMRYFIPSHYTYEVIAGKDGQDYVFSDPYLKKVIEENLYVPDRSYRIPVPENARHIHDLDEWRKIFDGKAPETRRNPEAVAALAPELANHLLHSVHTFATQYNIPGLYSDGNWPMPNFRIKGDALACRDSRGDVRPFYDVGAYRNMYKRARAIILKADPANGLMIAHNSGVRLPQTLTFFDFMLYGETDFYWYQEPEKRDASANGDYYYAHIWGDIDNLKVHYPRQWGMPQVLLPELRGRDRKTFPNPAKGTRTMLCYMIQFDQLYWPLWCDAREVLNFDAIRHKFGMADTEREIVEFVPYWENRIFAAGDPGIKIGYYEKILQHDPYFPEQPRKRFLVLVSNLQFGDGRTRVALPPELKNPKVTDCAKNASLPLVEGKVEIKLEPYDFTVLEVTGEME